MCKFVLMEEVGENSASLPQPWPVLGRATAGQTKLADRPTPKWVKSPNSWC